MSHSCLGSWNQVFDFENYYVYGLGFNDYAVSNNLIMVYPQSSLQVLDENGCFDFFGFTNSNFESTSSVQIKYIDRLIKRLQQPIQYNKYNYYSSNDLKRNWAQIMFGVPFAVFLEIPFVTLEFFLFVFGYMMYLINGL